jgi:hypothetical protein
MIAVACCVQLRTLLLVCPALSLKHSVLTIAGFFGFPAEEQYNLEVMVESPGFNCTLAPYGVVSLVSLVWLGYPYSLVNQLLAVSCSPSRQRHCTSCLILA